MADSRFFKKSGPFTLAEICEQTKIEIPENADPLRKFEGICFLEEATSKDISSYHHNKYLLQLQKTNAGICFVMPEAVKYVPSATVALVTKQPYRCFGKIASMFFPSSVASDSISPLASIHATAKIGKNCTIHPYAIIEENVSIGDDSVIGSHTVIKSGSVLGAKCVIESHVVITHALIGDEVYIKPGARIGQPGFGFHMDSLGHFNIPQLGRVIIGNDVQIGSNTTIDRGSLTDTKIGNGARIDNLVQIAHNVEIGDNSVLVAQVGIAGSTKLGRFVIVAGQVGISGHLTVGDGVKIAAQSGIMRNVDKGETIAGSPAIPVRDWHKQTIALKRLIKGK
ncbi:MAG: UDP-3-O-(3-hydroxymyristoyl)glucosamine N-acyltransferase [Alphaproteobacteria bacterium]|nr:UDP-3-O-(3-hydroxymyristoyl)glucosamine N-acyltransferase [Alphaproteobacteria bacterium]